MAMLKKVGQRFYHHFEVIEGGSGLVSGLLSETEQQAQPSYVFIQPRHVFRVPFPSALRAGMVIRSNAGEVYIVGENGPSERKQGTIWQSYRLFEATKRVTWARRTKIIDPITTLPRDKLKEENLGMIWVALEPFDREAADREIRFSFEQHRVIAGVEILAEDLIDNRAVTKVDKQLGLSIGVVT
jgi:hypothetical protein